MENLSNKIQAYLNRKPDFIEEVKLQDDGDGVVYIKEWNAKDKAKPTDEQLNALETEATKLDNNAKAELEHGCGGTTGTWRRGA